MARYAIIVSGLVHNVIEADPGFANALAAQLGGAAVPSATAGPGDAHAAGVFTPAVQAPRTPDLVTKFQFVQALEDVAGVTEDAVDAALAALADGRPKRRLRAWWRTAWMVSRKGQLMNEFQALMGLSNAQVRSVFQAAESVGD